MRSQPECAIRCMDLIGAGYSCAEMFCPTCPYAAICDLSWCALDLSGSLTCLKCSEDLVQLSNT